MSQSLSGWDGVFHRPKGGQHGAGSLGVAIPFRVGWGFSLIYWNEEADLSKYFKVAIPFRVGWGFSLGMGLAFLQRYKFMSQSLSGWDGVFHLKNDTITSLLLAHVAIPFRVGWGFSLLGAEIGRITT